MSRARRQFVHRQSRGCLFLDMIVTLSALNNTNTLHELPFIAVVMLTLGC
jgi:hypothetical protein